MEYRTAAQSSGSSRWGRARLTHSANRPNASERGQTLLLVAISLAVVVGMAALAIDVTNLYLARSQAEKAADAAALAGAKAFVRSSFTSGGLGSPLSEAAQSQVCNGGSGLADRQAVAEANQNKIAGVQPGSVATSCNLATPGNPRIAVTVTRDNLPTFFGRIFHREGELVRATSRAEAYNPAGQPLPISVGSVKPWLVSNCDATNAAPANPNCPGSAYFLDPSRNYAVANSGNFIGQRITLQQILPGVVPLNLLNSYYMLNMPISSASAFCPAESAPSCGPIDAGSPGYFESVACANSVQLTCGPSDAQGVSVSLLGGILSPPNADRAVQCLIHADDYGSNQGQDSFEFTGIGDPMTIDGGYNNPNPQLRSIDNISRSDSVVTVPIWDGNGACNPGVLCPPFKIVGFMQLGILRVRRPALGILGSGRIDARILNIAGCGSASGTAISGGGGSPIPVRLVQ